MRKYERLAEEDRMSRRTIADALAVLEQEAAFGKNDRATIKVGVLPSRVGGFGVVLLIFDEPASEKSYAVSLPSARHFHGFSANSDRKHLKIELLDKAVTDYNGDVELITGERLRAVEIVAEKILVEPTFYDWCIIHGTLSFMMGGERLYISVKDLASSAIRDMVPDLKLLDLHELEMARASLTVPSLYSIKVYLKQKHKALAFSEKTIARVLNEFGLRFPRQH